MLLEKVVRWKMRKVSKGRSQEILNLNIRK